MQTFTIHNYILYLKYTNNGTDIHTIMYNSYLLILCANIQCEVHPLPEADVLL